MKNYEDLMELLKTTQATGGLDCDIASVCEYQDMIGHSSAEQLKEIANGAYKESFYRVYGVAYGTLESIKFYMENSEKVTALLYERDGLRCDVEELKEDLAEAGKRADTLRKSNDEIYTENLRLKEENATIKAELVRLKAKLFDMMEAAAN